ncbi:RNA-binding S4 domain-containing protein [Marininema halotolerans]|nr:hypothetical protein [Marininema halotolerans]
MINPQQPAGLFSESIPEVWYRELLQTGITFIQIDIEYVDKRHRLDLTLSTRIKDMSRETIQKKIKQGTIQVNHLHVAPNYSIRTKDTITILVQDI